MRFQEQLQDEHNLDADQVERLAENLCRVLPKYSSLRKRFDRATTLFWGDPKITIKLADYRPGGVGGELVIMDQEDIDRDMLDRLAEAHSKASTEGRAKGGGRKSRRARSLQRKKLFTRKTVNITPRMLT